MTTKIQNKTFFRMIPQTLALTTALLFSASCTTPAAQPAQATKQSALLGQDGAMTISLPNTIVNRYAALGADVAQGSTDLTVDNIADLLPLDPGDMLLVIQMQGAEIDQSDAASYGSMVNLNNAGRHEFVTVSSVTGNTITIEGGCSGLQNDYAAAGHVQVVRVPQATSLLVESGGRMTAPPWDGRVGGIIAVHVNGAARIDGQIDVSGMGFRGGAADNDSSKLADDIVAYRGSASTDGAEKGEGIAGSAADYDLIGGRYGRGAPANGGGGGNSYNAGGGGGANGDSSMSYSGTGVMDGSLGNAPWDMDPDVMSGPGGLCASSGGGRGGYSYSDQLADPMVDAPGSALWGGNLRAERGGRGGHPVSNAFTGRLFMGGGGGAGDGNDGAAGSGGAGGGIVYLIAQSVVGGGSIYANGQTGSQGGGSAVDGAGGGGAGGSVIVRADSVDSVAVFANGGDGGTQMSSGMDAAGPGGGGGGGFIALPWGVASASAVGGTSGVSSSATMATWNLNGATLGAQGQPFESAVVTLGMQTTLCAPTDISLQLAARNGQPIPGSELLYTIAVNNRGLVQSRFTKIRDLLPVEIANSRWRCTAQNGAVCPIDSGTGAIDVIADLPAGGELDFEVVLPIPTTVKGTLSYGFEGIPSAVVNEVSPADNQIQIADMLAPQADLVVSVSADAAKVHPGDKNRYTVLTANRGFSAAGSLTTQLTLSSGVTPVVEQAEGWQCAVEQNIVKCTRPDLDVGLAKEIVVSVQAPAGLKEINATAEVKADVTPDPILANNSSWFGVAVEEVQIPVPTPTPTPPPSVEHSTGCSVSPSGAAPQNSLWAALFGLVAAALRRNRRRPV